MFPNVGNNANSGMDTALLMSLANNGGLGNNGFLYLMFLWLMWQRNGRGQGGSDNDAILAQMNNDTGRDLLMQAINGRANSISQLAQITNNSVESVRAAVNALQVGIQSVGTQVGMSGLEVQNAIAMGNASLSRQLCECCCENRLAIANQTAALQSTLAAHDASVRLQLAQNEAADQLAVCQQTNTLRSDYSNGTNNILNAIANQNTMITKEFCDLKEREMQNKINTQGDIITQLRGQISNDAQTKVFTDAINALNAKITAIAAKQPNTVPVEYPNITAINTTPNVGLGVGFGNGFGGGIIL